MIDKNDLVTVYVYPDGENHYEPVNWKSNDYKVRKTAECDKCHELLLIDYDAPIASCACTSQEWHY